MPLFAALPPMLAPRFPGILASILEILHSLLVLFARLFQLPPSFVSQLARGHGFRFSLLREFRAFRHIRGGFGHVGLGSLQVAFPGLAASLNHLSLRLTRLFAGFQSL